ncbi:ABC transporter permease [Paenibacillus sp. CAA11]|uniref:ABC transporter permease n=1 Tax=Paenibacillus sp. CAA11 TaxID=1532905 RepID=UPI000D3D2B5D|nr:ABC transporter permease [Paenibacillus sp. CAA11]AWB46186.1 ABC transporter permease [Paenibacillus sp. CAA11]
MIFHKMTQLFNYRSLLMNFVSKEIKLKYKDSVLGFIWSFMNPLIMLFIYTFVFKHILKFQIENFELFLFAGLLAWNFFNISINTSANSLIYQGNLLKKVYFPREIIPLSIVLSNLLNYFIMSVIIVVATVIVEGGLSVYIYLYPLVLVTTVLFTTGISFIVSILTVKFRDISYLVDVILLFLFYLTPIVYSNELVPKEYASIINGNPITEMVNLHRAVFLPTVDLHWDQLSIFTCLSIIVFLIGYTMFKKGEMGIVEKL